MAGAYYKLDKLYAIVDNNKLQCSGRIEEKMNLNPLPEKWKAFGWHTIEIDDHSFKDILVACK